MKAVVLTGAGISAESGLPTFRDADGLREGQDRQDVATPEAFAADPDPDLVRVAIGAGARTVELNIEPPAVSNVSVVRRRPATETVPALVQDLIA